MKQKTNTKKEEKMIEIIIKKEEKGFIVDCAGHKSEKYASIEDAKKEAKKVKEIVEKLIGASQIRL